MQPILEVAAAPAQRGSSGPTTFRALRDTLTDDGSQLQLVARVGDDERFLLVTRETHPTVPLVDRVNERNARRHEIDARLSEIDAVLAKHDVGDVDTDDSATLAGLPADVVNALAERDTLTAERKGLPKIDADRAARVARALMLYSQQDEEAGA